MPLKISKPYTSGLVEISALTPGTGVLYVNPLQARGIQTLRSKRAKKLKEMGLEMNEENYRLLLVP